MLRRFLDDTLDMILDGLARLGLLRGGSAWWRHRMARRVERASADAENTRRAVRAEYRMCRECRALVRARERVCHDCGASMAGIPKGGAGRMLALLVPSLGSASITLVGAMVTLFVAMMAAAGGIAWRSDFTQLIQLGGMNRGLVLGAGEWWRLVNPIFLHGDWLHLAFNGYALANLGPILESIIGARRFLVVFMTTGIVSFCVSMATGDPRGLSVGASGALFGLIGFGIVHGYLRAGPGGRFLADQLLRWAMFGVLMIFLPMPIDHWAHGGGFVAGAVLGWAVRGGVPRHAVVDRAWTVAAVVLSVLPVVGFALAFLASNPA